MVRVTQVHHISDYKLLLVFSDGSRRTVDLTGELYGEVFEPLKDLSFFKSVYVNNDTGTIEWSNGADFSPEFLIEASSVAMGEAIHL